MKTINMFLIIYVIIISTYNVLAQEQVTMSDIEFSKVKKINTENIPIDDIPLIPIHIALDRNRVLILDKGENTYFRIYSYPEFKLKIKTGLVGYGPDEIAIQPVISYFRNDTIEFYNFSKSSVFQMSVSENPSEVKLLNVLDPDLMEAQDALILENGIIAGTGCELGRLYFFNPSTKTTDYIPFLKSTQSLPNNRNNIFNAGEVDCTKDRQKIIYAAKYFDHFDIFNFKGEPIYTYSNATLKDQVFMENGQITTDNTKLYYTSVYITNKHIYLMYLGGLSYNEILKMIDKNKFTCEIQQFTLTGFPKNCYIIDMPLRSFCVDEENSRIIAINPLSEEFPLVSFNMD